MTDATITQNSLGASGILRSNAGQRNLPPIQSFILTKMGHGLVQSIMLLAKADGFDNYLVYGKKITWFKDNTPLFFVHGGIFSRYWQSGVA